MYIITKIPNESGAYSSPQTWDDPILPVGYATISDTIDMTGFFAYNGFVTLTIDNDAVTSYAPNEEAWVNWKSSLPPIAEKEPSEEEDTAAMLIDHEFRLTMLELGLSE